MGHLRLRVRSYVVLEGLPIALLILYFFARQADGQQSFQGVDVGEGGLEFSQRTLFFGFGSIARRQGSFQAQEVAPSSSCASTCRLRARSASN